MTEFREDLGSERLDPLYESKAEFPFDEVSSRLGEIADDTPDEMRERLGIAVREILRLCVPPLDAQRRDAFVYAGQRALALAWIICPDLLGDRSIRQLAEVCGCTAPVLSVLTAEFSRELGIRNRYQSHDWRREAAKKIRTQAEGGSDAPKKN